MATSWEKAKKTTKRTTTKKSSEKQIKDAEKKLDSAMENAQDYISKNVSPETRKKTEELVHKADAVVWSMEDLGATFLDDVFWGIYPNKKWSKATFEAEFSPTFSRLFIFRFLRYIVQAPVQAIWWVWYMLIAILYTIMFFISGERNKNLWNRMVRFWKHTITWKAYVIGLTDKRPPMVTPKIT